MKQTHSHDILAKLLATENLSVIRDNVPTASFDILNRVLRLPRWKKLTSEIEEMLILHEVGHALYTTVDGYGAIYESKPHLKGYANIIEDVRIEKKMKQRYPGSRKSFNIGYTELNKQDFFGVKDRDLSTLLLIDRINVFYKVGYGSGVTFTAEEYEFVRKADQCVTEKDVIDLAEEIYNFCKEQVQAEQEEKQKQYQYETIDGDPDEDGIPLDLDPETIDAFNNKLSALHDSESRTYYFDAKFKYETDNVIIDHKTVASEMTSAYSDYDFIRIKQNASSFKTSTANVVNYLVKEFEMRKSASAFKRAKISKLGQLDSRKLFAYKLKDDIFKQIMTVQEGKKHGMLFLLDWSGSMSSYMEETVQQVVSLAMFCQKINIPYQVLAFSDGYYESSREIIKTNDNGLDDSRTLTLFELFSHKMTTREFNRMIEIMLDKPYNRRASYQLHGTPLNAALLFCADYIGKFIHANQVEKMSLITLTDGESNGLYSNNNNIPSGRAYVDEDNKPVTVNRTSILRDDVTKREYVITEIAQEQTAVLMDLIRNRYGIRSVGFFITNTTFKSIERMLKYSLGNNYKTAYSSATKIYEDIRKNKCAIVKDMPGRDEFYVISSTAKIQDDELGNVNGGMTASQISRQLSKVMTSGKTSRVVLNSFVGMVA